MSDTNKRGNQGEGDRESARRYNEAQQEFVESGGVEAHEDERRKDQDKVSAEPTEAERRAAARAAEEDPAVRRDYDAGKK